MPNPVSSLGQGFPSINMPLVDPQTGVMNQAWYQFFIALFNRTGQGGGGSVFDGVALATGDEGQGTDEELKPAIDVMGAEASPDYSIEQGALLALAFTDDATSGAGASSNVFYGGITVNGGAVVFGGEALSGGLILTDTGLDIQAGGATIVGGLDVFDGEAVSGGLIVTNAGLNVQAGGETIVGGSSIFNGLAVAGGAQVAGGLDITSGGETVTGGLAVSGASQLSGGLGVGTIFGPQIDNNISCGTAGLRFTDVFAVSGSVNPSDIRRKEDIRPVPPCLNIVLSTEPITWKWRHDAWKDGRVHWGFDARALDSTIKAQTQIDCAAVMVDEEGFYNLRAHELLPIIWQALREVVSKLETQQWR